MLEYLLALHIVGAFVAVLYVVIGIVQIAISRGSGIISKYVAVSVSFFQIISGGLLVVFNPSVSIRAVCIKGFFMIGAVAITHLLLARRLQTSKISVKY